MKLFKPQLQLARENEKQADGSYKSHYYLHTVTICNTTNYRLSEEDTKVEPINADGVIKVKIYVYPHSQIIDLNYLTPIVHTVDLGTPVENDRPFTVKVDLFKELPTRGDENAAGSSEAGSTQADEDARPII